VLYNTPHQLSASSSLVSRIPVKPSYKALFTRLAGVALLTLSLGLSAFGAHLLDTSATSFSHHLLTSHHLYSPAPFAGGGCGATPSDC